MPKKDDTIEPIDDDFDNVVETVVNPAPIKQSQNNSLSKYQGLQPAEPYGMTPLIPIDAPQRR